jgi:hypothetical protein
VGAVRAARNTLKTSLDPPFRIIGHLIAIRF